MKIIIQICWAFLMLAISHAIAAEENGKQIDQQLCSICHGAGGVTSSELFPQLAGQPAGYLTNQLKAFRDKSRSDKNAERFMWGVASRLSDEDIDQLAKYYQSQPVVHNSKINSQPQYDSGKHLFTEGRGDKGVPACMACHGEHGEGNGTVPRLAAQHQAYLKRQLKVFYTNERPAAIAMHEIVKGLSDDDINAVVEYLQAQ